MNEQKFREFGIELEISTRYHERRRSFFEFVSAVVKVVSLLGAALAFAAISNWAPDAMAAAVWVAIASAAIAFVNVLDLVFNFDGKARLHTELYRRFKELQASIAREKTDFKESGDEWEAEAQTIRMDEPTTKWAVYALCWNQTMEKHGVDMRIYERPVSLIQAIFKNIISFQPKSFLTRGERGDVAASVR